MLELIVGEGQIAEAQAQFQRAVASLASSKIRVSIGYQSGQSDAEVLWLPDLGYWAYFGFPPEEKSPGERYWNVFGLGKPSGLVSIVCEINPPIQGVNRRAAGAFAVAPSGDIFLVHRGIINVRGRVKKDYLFSVFKGIKESMSEDGRISRVIVIGALKAENFPELVRDFVVEVDRVKNLVRATR